MTVKPKLKLRIDLKVWSEDVWKMCEEVWRVRGRN